MERDWERLAKAIKQAREAAGMTQKDLAKRAEVSEGSVQNLEDPNRRPTRIPQSLAKVEAALGWAVGSGVAILQGATGPVTWEPIGGNVVIAKLPEDELHEAITMSAIAVNDNLTAREIRELSQKIIEELKERGML